MLCWVIRKSKEDNVKHTYTKNETIINSHFHVVGRSKTIERFDVNLPTYLEEFKFEIVIP